DQIDHIRPYLLPLLNSKSADVRLKAAAFAALRLDPSHVSEILGDYIAQSTYFYNVTTALDRALYAPEPLKKAFRALLANELEENAVRQASSEKEVDVPPWKSKSLKFPYLH